MDARRERQESDMARAPAHGAPAHPGKMILEEFLKPLV
jgi:hypothetical protein